jgi:hypothetical protein
MADTACMADCLRGGCSGRRVRVLHKASYRAPDLVSRAIVSSGFATARFELHQLIVQ